MKLIFIAQNYADHVKEIGKPLPESLVFFLKPDSVLRFCHHKFQIPSWASRVDSEIELVVRIEKEGKDIPRDESCNYFNSLSVGIDFTERFLYEEASERGLPWEKAKAFDGAAFVGSFLEKPQDLECKGVSFKLKKNDVVIQSSNSKKMIYSFSEIISEVSKYLTLYPGDLIYTGTPFGVEAVSSGDKLECYVNECCVLKFEVA